MRLPSPPPVMTIPSGAMQVAVTPWLIAFEKGLEALKSFCGKLTCTTSPLAVPQYAYSSRSSTAITLNTRRSCPMWMACGRILRLWWSKSHTFRL